MANNKKNEAVIISLGGSLVAPDGVDVAFLKNFRHILQKYVGNTKFFILVGGGKIARSYQNALLEFGAKNTARDWIGIDVTRLNAKIIIQMFEGNAHPKVVEDPTKEIKTGKNIIVGGGYKPGWSTDYVSVLMAKKHGIKTIINLTNIDYVYDKDPNKFQGAKPLKELDWKSFSRIVGDKWLPGLSMPFDPRASKLASSLGLKVIMINGTHLDRLENFLQNNPFIGTIIQ